MQRHLIQNQRQNRGRCWGHRDQKNRIAAAAGLLQDLPAGALAQFDSSLRTSHSERSSIRRNCYIERLEQVPFCRVNQLPIRCVISAHVGISVGGKNGLAVRADPRAIGVTEGRRSTPFTRAAGDVPELHRRICGADSKLASVRGKRHAGDLFF